MEKPKDEIEEVKQADLSPAMIAQFTTPKKTWFIERTGDKKVMAMEEMEAWKTLTNKSTWARHDFRIVGVSDGKTYAKIVQESQGKAREMFKVIKDIETEANKYRKTEEKFVFEDLLELTDPKVVKVKSIIAKYDKDLEKNNAEYLAITKNVAKTAFDAELAKAKRSGNREFPSNQDIFTPGSDAKTRRKILREMGEE